jgi:hypothetical protein
MRSGATLAHHDVQHACCWLVGDGDAVVQCGLWCGHDEDHLSLVPGEYLPVPLVLLLPGRRGVCPLCGEKARAFGDGPFQVFRRDGDGFRATTEVSVRFVPCGCEGRQIVEEQR